MCLSVLLSELQAGVLIGGAEPLLGGYWSALYLLRTLLLGFLEGGFGRGFSGVMSGLRGGLIGEVVRGAIFASKCILKVEYAKGVYIPGLEITCFAPEFRGFWKKMVFECNNSPRK